VISGPGVLLAIVAYFAGTLWVSAAGFRGAGLKEGFGWVLLRSAARVPRLLVLTVLVGVPLPLVFSFLAALTPQSALVQLPVLALMVLLLLPVYLGTVSVSLGRSGWGLSHTWRLGFARVLRNLPVLAALVVMVLCMGAVLAVISLVGELQSTPVMALALLLFVGVIPVPTAALVAAYMVIEEDNGEEAHGSANL
jgi:hypothetical protein